MRMYENLLNLNDIGLENEVVGELDPNELVELEREYVELTHLTGHLDMVSRMVERVGEVEEQIKDPSLSLKEQRILSNSVKRMSSLFMDSTGIEIGLESASLVPALEVASTLKKWWDALMKFLRSIWDKIKSFFKRIFGIEEKVKKETKKKISNIEKTLDELAKKDLSSTPKAVNAVKKLKTDLDVMVKDSTDAVGKITIPTMTPPITKTYKTTDGETKTAEVHDKGKVSLINKTVIEINRAFSSGKLVKGLNFAFITDAVLQTVRVYRGPVLLRESEVVAEYFNGLDRIGSTAGYNILFDVTGEYTFDVLAVLSDPSTRLDPINDVVESNGSGGVVITSKWKDKMGWIKEHIDSHEGNGSGFGISRTISLITEGIKEYVSAVETNLLETRNYSKADISGNIKSVNALSSVIAELKQADLNIWRGNLSLLNRLEKSLEEVNKMI